MEESRRYIVARSHSRPLGVLKRLRGEDGEGVEEGSDGVSAGEKEGGLELNCVGEGGRWVNG